MAAKIGLSPPEFGLHLIREIGMASVKDSSFSNTPAKLPVMALNTLIDPFINPPTEKCKFRICPEFLNSKLQTYGIAIRRMQDTYDSVSTLKSSSELHISFQAGNLFPGFSSR